MRAGGRLAAAIEVLGEIEMHRRPVAEALKDWGVSHRFAGSGDRAAIGNLVYDALRRRSSAAWLMGEDTPRALVLATAARCWTDGVDGLARLIDGDPHAPEALTPSEFDRLGSADLARAPDHVRADLALRHLGAERLMHELDRALDGQDVATARLVHVIDHRGRRRRLAVGGRARYDHQTRAPLRQPPESVR